jgi:5-methylcytosine-specific restriction endonuclease McrA
VGRQNSFISLEELALPYALEIAQHVKQADWQATSPSSTFLQACREYNTGEVSQAQLIDTAARLGFNNVLDAFHHVNRVDLPVKFFEKSTQGRTKGIILTDGLLALGESAQFGNLSPEAEARWRLVETAWKLNISTNLLEVTLDPEQQTFYVSYDSNSRVDITSSRDALNGYQKGKCFYCFTDISVASKSSNLADVDHYFPHTLGQFTLGLNLNGVWNLVLACQGCNRGPKGKFAQMPQSKYLERLHKRNSFLIDSHHPLRETLIRQSGASEPERRAFLQQMDKRAINVLVQRWAPEYEHQAVF